MYARCKSTDDACKVFDEMLEKDVVSWNALITGYAQDEDAEKALVLFCEMLRFGFKPDHFTFGSVLKATGALSSGLTGRQLHGTCMKCGCEEEVNVGTAIVDMYARCGLIDDAKFAFDKLRCKDEVSWNALITGYSQNEGAEEALVLFCEMLRFGFKPNPNTFGSVLKATGALCSGLTGRQLHGTCMKCGCEERVNVGNAIVNMYAKCGLMDDAKIAFDKLRCKNAASWNALITGYSQDEEALVLFCEMLRFGFKPDHFTFGSVLKATGALCSGLTSKQLHGTCMKCGCEEEVNVGNAIVDMYARGGLMEDAKSAFDKLRCKNEDSWNALIARHARKSEGEIALMLFSEMKRGGFQPTHYIFSSVFSACASIGSLEPRKWVHVHMIKSGLKLLDFVGSTLLDMYAKSGSIDDAKKVFDRLVEKNVVSCNSMLNAYAQHGFGKEAVECFEEMCKIGIEPDEVTFLCVLTACSHAGLLDEGMHYFELMKKSTIVPNSSHYTTIVYLLSRSGQLDRAKMFINEMPIKPNANVWKALLGACRISRNMELGVHEAEHVFELDPYDAGSHILLSNIYASAGRINDAEKVRKVMNEKGVKKEPGCS